MTSHEDVSHMIQAETARQLRIRAAQDQARPHQMVRILIYEGPEDWLRDTIPGRAVKGVYHIGPGKSIREVFLSEFPVPLSDTSGEDDV